jgi:integrase
MLPGERLKERVATPEETSSYLTVAPEPLASVVVDLLDTGLRPQECFQLRWESITRNNAWHGTLRITHGKTAAARRVLPLAHRIRNALEFRWGGSR